MANHKEEELGIKFLKQPFAPCADSERVLEDFLSVPLHYARIENAVAVLSDLIFDKSYIYYGRVAERLGLAHGEGLHVIPSIWEKHIFDLIHPDDLVGKHVSELRFLHFLKKIPRERWEDFHLWVPIRMRCATGEYVRVMHRIFHLSYDGNNCYRFALGVYNLQHESSIDKAIVDSATGDVVKLDERDFGSILSKREIDVLRLIEQGKSSKEIAAVLFVSIHTVSRHRQNILQKLRVDNSMEACNIARKLNWLK